MRCALESASFGLKKMQRIQSRSLLLICIRVRWLFRFGFSTFRAIFCKLYCSWNSTQRPLWLFQPHWLARVYLSTLQQPRAMFHQVRFCAAGALEQRLPIPNPQDSETGPVIPSKNVSELNSNLGGGFKHFLHFHPYFSPILGNYPIWQAYSSDGLKPPTRNKPGSNNTVQNFVHQFCSC